MNRRNLLNLALASPLALLPLFGRTQIEKLLPFQEEILSDITKYKHNIFILPRGSGKTWLCNYLGHYGCIPKNKEDRFFNKKNRTKVVEGFVIYDEFLNNEDFYWINRIICYDKQLFKYTNLAKEEVFNKRLIMFTSINNDFSCDLLKRAYEDTGLLKNINLNIKKIPASQIGPPIFDKELEEWIKEHCGEKIFLRDLECEFI